MNAAPYTSAMLNEAATLGITPLQAYRRERAREEVRRARVVRSTNWIK